MTTPSLRTLTTASLVGLIIATIFITAITLIGDLYVVGGKTVLKDSLKAMFGHHWVGKGILAVLVYVVATLAAYPWVKRSGCVLTPFMLRLAANIIIAGSLVMLLFFCYEYLKH